MRSCTTGVDKDKDGKDMVLNKAEIFVKHCRKLDKQRKEVTAGQGSVMRSCITGVDKDKDGKDMALSKAEIFFKDCRETEKQMKEVTAERHAREGRMSKQSILNGKRLNALNLEPNQFVPDPRKQEGTQKKQNSFNERFPNDYRVPARSTNFLNFP